MRRVWLVLALVAAPHLAQASHHCRETSTIVGYETCTRFGARWSGFATAWLELGVVSLHFDPQHDSGPAQHVAAADDRPITAAGGRLRWLVGLGRTWFFGTEVDVASVTSGPGLVADAVARAGGSTIGAATGFVGQSKMVIGVHHTYGLVTLAGLVGSGARLVVLEAHQLPPPNDLAQAAFLVDAHAKADAWLTPNITIGVDASVDVLRRDDYAFGLTLGLHILPYDRTR